MVTSALLPRENSQLIRRFDVARDLENVADLIEMCFPIASDPDGQQYVNQMRKSAREMRFLGWLTRFSEGGNMRAYGFVCEENERIIGNLSLIPYRSGGSHLIMIANVAVHPDYRRKGIAKRLTKRALGYLQRQNVRRVWLQVRDNNPSAINLYRSLGFKDRAVRTTWRIRPGEIDHYRGLSSNEIKVYPRKQMAWPMQKELLAQIYPQFIRWNFPVKFSRFTPGCLQHVINFLDGYHLRHWAIGLKNKLTGIISWQKTDSFANNLWLAISEEDEDEVLPTGLIKVCKRLSQQHPISIDYPVDRFRKQFEGLGFKEFRTLIWMEANL